MRSHLYLYLDPDDGSPEPHEDCQWEPTCQLCGGYFRGSHWLVPIGQLGVGDWIFAVKRMNKEACLMICGSCCGNKTRICDQAVRNAMVGITTVALYTRQGVPMLQSSYEALSHPLRVPSKFFLRGDEARGDTGEVILEAAFSLRDY